MLLTGEYLFNPRAWNVSVNGQTFLEWFIDDCAYECSRSGRASVDSHRAWSDIFGPSGASNPNISGFYFG